MFLKIGLVLDDDHDDVDAEDDAIGSGRNWKKNVNDSHLNLRWLHFVFTCRTGWSTEQLVASVAVASCFAQLALEQMDWLDMQLDWPLDLSSRSGSMQRPWAVLAWRRAWRSNFVHRFSADSVELPRSTGDFCQSSCP